MNALMTATIVAATLVAVGCESPKVAKEPPIPPKQAPADTGKKPEAEKQVAKEPTGEGWPLLSRVLTHYGSLKTFSATSQVRWIFDDKANEAVLMDRLVLFQHPNKFRVVNITGNLKATAVSDGTTVLEHTNSEAMLYNAANTMADSNSLMISNENYCGSLLYDFFSGPRAAMSIVSEENGEVRTAMGKDNKERVLSFRARNPYGDVQLTIDEPTLNITSIRADMAPRLKEMNASDPKNSLKSMVMTQTFSNIRVDQTMATAAFDTTPPSGLKIKDRRGEFGINTPAPLFELSDLDGKSVRLKDLREQIVVLLFYTTLSNPSRDAIELARSAKEQFSGRGVSVFGLAPEPTEVLRVFQKEYGLGFDTLSDPKQEVFKKYQMVSEQPTEGGGKAAVFEVPTFVIIDRRGKISQILSGVPTEHDLLKALRLAGFALN